MLASAASGTSASGGGRGTSGRGGGGRGIGCDGDSWLCQRCHACIPSRHVRVECLFITSHKPSSCGESMALLRDFFSSNSAQKRGT